jgi:hypothetical protein
VYGDLHNSGTIVGIPLSAPFSTWTDLSTTDFFILGGTGGGGAGGDGQMALPPTTRSTTASLTFGFLLGVHEGQQPSSGVQLPDTSIGADNHALLLDQTQPAASAPAPSLKPAVVLVGGAVNAPSASQLAALDAVFADILTQ